MSDASEFDIADFVTEKCYANTTSLRADVGRFFADSNRSFIASRNSGKKQKIYFCSGQEGGCIAEVRAFKIRTGEWKVNKIVGSHTNCSGGKIPGRSAALKHIAEQAVKDTPDILGIALKRKMERDSGLKVHHRTATRMKNIAKGASRTAVEGSYQQLASLCAQLQTDCPGTVAEVEVSKKSF